MVGFIRSLLKIGSGVYAAKIAAATNGDKKLLTDRNLTNMTVGAVAGVYAIPKIKETLDNLVTGAANGQRPDVKRITKYAIFGALGASVAYALENGVYDKAITSVKGLYDKSVKPKSS